jgi:hypothetical protein
VTAIPTVLQSIPHILTPVQHILTTVEPILTTIPHVFHPVPQTGMTPTQALGIGITCRDKRQYTGGQSSQQNFPHDSSC